MAKGEPGRRLALARLRTAILDGAVGPGQRLVEDELASTYQVTRASARAALIDLAGEGLVERIPHRGARVRAISVAEAVAITECRAALEGLCAAKAATRATDEDLAALAGIADGMRAAVSAGDPLRYSELNRALHQRVRQAAGQPVAAELLERLHGQIVHHQFRLSLRPGRPQVSLPEHLAIIDAVTRRDPAAAEAAVRAHLASVITALHEADNVEVLP